MSIAGETFTLECSVSGTIDIVIFQWLAEQGTPVVSDGSRTITNSASGSYLHFGTLQQSHEGTYTCNATIDGAAESKSINLSVNGIGQCMTI